MTPHQLRKLFLDFFQSKNHQIIPSASLVPDNDPTTLFITAGMHPLVPYLLGQPHPGGKRLASIQKCVRTTDIDEVGDLTHLTFFEMLGNWSLGDYFKREAILWSWEFLTSPKWLGLDKEKLFVSVFAGDTNAPRDEESAAIWQKIFTSENVSNPEKRIFYYPKSENWWGPAGNTGPCGPDTEIFYYTGKASPFAAGFSDEPAADNSDFIEIWNNVFMQYNKNSDGSYTKLKQHNVDTGLGLERMVGILNWIKGKTNSSDLFLSPLFSPTIKVIENITSQKYQEGNFNQDSTKNNNSRSIRIVADHLRSGVFIVGDGVFPSNKERGYVLRRLIRRSARELYKLGLSIEQLDGAVTQILQSIVNNEQYQLQYPEIAKQADQIIDIIVAEITKFSKTLHKGLVQAEKIQNFTGQEAFDLYQTYGFPLEMTREIAEEKGQSINLDTFKAEFAKHQEKSRQESAGKYKGGLADHSETATKYHTATHLLHTALRKFLGDHIHQEGSNITAARLRFDFSHQSALSESEIEQIENWVNEQIDLDWPVTQATMPKTEALKGGALAFFKEKYPDIVSVYTIGQNDQIISQELCGGPHVKHTGEIGHIQLIKQKNIGSGVRRLYLKLADS